MTERELNLRVHRDVMGGTILGVEEMRSAWECGCEVQYVGRERIEFTVIPHPIVGGEPEFIQDVPDYAGSIADAWRVVEKMHERGLWVRVDSEWSDIGGWTWLVEWGERETPFGHFRRDRTAPVTICRAALAANSPEIPRDFTWLGR